jgi:hypothetical protein
MIDADWTENVVCPWCGAKQDTTDLDLQEGGVCEVDCWTCGRDMEIHTHVVTTYTTRRPGDCCYDSVEYEAK